GPPVVAGQSIGPRKEYCQHKTLSAAGPHIRRPHIGTSPAAGPVSPPGTRPAAAAVSSAAPHTPAARAKYPETLTPVSRSGHQPFPSPHRHPLSETGPSADNPNGCSSGSGHGNKPESDAGLRGSTPSP